MTDRIYSDDLLDVIEACADGAPPFEEAGVEHITYSPRVTGENSTVRMMNVTIDGDVYLVVVKKVGG